MTVPIDQFLAALRAAYGGTLPLNAEQRKALVHDYQTPLWIIAGPGTGKTHTLVWLVLKRLLVDGVPAKRIFLTTFTRKAAAELESRLITSRKKLIEAKLGVAEQIDVSHMYIGTLHSLCARILQDARYDPTLRIRVLEDERVQQFFLRRNQNPLVNHAELSFWQRIGAAGSNDNYPPSKAKRAEGASKLLNRVTENRIAPAALKASGDDDLAKLGEAYEAYEEALLKEHRSDQAHLQRHFLDFLATPAGKEWLGEGLTVLVDEYQDTNPIQEAIYFTLAGTKHDLTVVGDDDQSLYRFRGATVESLIDFDRACSSYLRRQPTAVYLTENRRSHPQIVEWVNRFIGHHPEMRDPRVRVRAPDKPLLESKSTVDGSYPAIMLIDEKTHSAAATKLVKAVEDLMTGRYVTDYSQIALLTFSTRETSQGIAAYTNALRAKGIPVYNPRSKRAHKDDHVLAMIGALCVILDPDFDPDKVHPKLPRGVPEYIQEARVVYQNLVVSSTNRSLAEYVQASTAAIKQARYVEGSGPQFLTRQGGRRVTITGLLYKILAHEPFATELTDAEGGERLKALNLILAEYESLYDDGELKLSKSSDTGERRIDKWTLYNLYAVLIEGIHDGLNDPEDDEVSIQDGMVNVMTIHQSKGLEFEVVFVLRPDKQPFVSDTHILEDMLDPYVTRPTKPLLRRTQDQRAAEDAIRLFFVAYSRAKRLLVLTGSKVTGWDRVLGRSAAGNALNSISGLKSLGVHQL